MICMDNMETCENTEEPEQHKQKCKSICPSGTTHSHQAHREKRIMRVRLTSYTVILLPQWKHGEMEQQRIPEGHSDPQPRQHSIWKNTFLDLSEQHLHPEPDFFTQHVLHYNYTHRTHTSHNVLSVNRNSCIFIFSIYFFLPIA